MYFFEDHNKEYHFTKENGKYPFKENYNLKCLF